MALDVLHILLLLELAERSRSIQTNDSLIVSLGYTFMLNFFSAHPKVRDRADRTVFGILSLSFSSLPSLPSI
jgi:hypothetical protein